MADARFCFRIPDVFDDVQAAPLLCAGLIGYRSLGKTARGKRLGIYGFGAAAHIVAQVARHEGREVFAFTRRGDTRRAGVRAQTRRGLGRQLPTKCRRRSSTPRSSSRRSGELVPLALRATKPGGVVVCGGIHMSDIPSFPYRDLWEERSICSVANLTRQDGVEFLEIAGRIPVKTTTTVFPLEQANEALRALRSGSLTGAAVLVP